MTYEEAIERIKKRICQEGAYREDKTYHFCKDACMCGEECCAISLAIKALEKQIDLREEKFERGERGMTNEEALDKITNLAVTYSQIDADTCELFTIAKEAIEKQIPKKINIIKEVLNAVCCPNCHYCLGDIEVRRRYKTEYKCCPNCGQHIDWSDKK